MLKVKLLGWILIGLSVAGLGQSLVVAQEVDWQIDEFVSEIEVQEDGLVAVRETIRVDFGNLSKHGIFRDLPVVYQNGTGSKEYSEISEIKVWQDGEPAEVLITSNQANLRIRIGDPDVTISGEHTYVIDYKVAGVLQGFANLDELNWNVTGNDWGVPIKKVSASLDWPVAVIQAKCYQGKLGSRQNCDNLIISESRVVAEAQDLSAFENLTVAVGYTPNVIPILRIEAPASPFDVLKNPVLYVVASLIGSVGSGWFVRRWWKYGRDRFAKPRPVIAEYESPAGLRPAELGVLMDEKANTLDVSASIVDLAARGYLTISEIPKKWIFGSTDYVFKKIVESDERLLRFELKLLEALFDKGEEVKLSELKNKFYSDLTKIKTELYEEGVRKKLFNQRPDKAQAKTIMYALAVEVMAAGCVSLGLAIINANFVGLGVGLAIMGLTGIVLSGSMPSKTKRGQEAYEKAQGYKLFLSTTEKYRARWMEDKGLFEKVLPYAIMFGVTDKLAKALAEMGIKPNQPTWYQGATAFNVSNFSSGVSSFSSSLSTAMASRPGGSSSGGGGFSGGGSGGGGGGSW